MEVEDRPTKAHVVKHKYPKWCFVPLCKCTSVRNPNKLFFQVPKNKTIRKNWFSVARRADKPTASDYYCCEDHFNKKIWTTTSDIDSGGNLKLKANILPHKFGCQPDRSSKTVDLNRPAFTEVNRKRKVDQLLNEQEHQSTLSYSSSGDNVMNSCEHNHNSVTSGCSGLEIVPNQNPDDLNNPTNEVDERPRSGEETLVMEQIINGTYKRPEPLGLCHTKKTRTKTIHVRSKGTMCQPMMVDSEIQVSVTTTDRACSPAHSLTTSTSALEESPTKSSIHPDNNSDYSYVPSSNGTSSSGKSVASYDARMRLTALNVTRYFISQKPRQNIGIPDSCSPWLMNLLVKYTSCTEDHMKLTLMTIRLDDTYERLGDHFGISTSQASRVFHKTVPVLAHLFKALIIQPTKHQVQKNLSIPFRGFYSNVFALVDALEIQMQKPSDPVCQASSWSEYKRNNTIKYEVLCTADGLIIRISKGYGGRITDITLFEERGMIDAIPAGSSLMADRGFKNIEHILHKKGCQLIRPPSVSQSQKPSKGEVLETKRIASLRIHVERLIRRIREFEILKPHACLDLNMMPLIDDVMYIVCGLINLQNPLIKT